MWVECAYLKELEARGTEWTRALRREVELEDTTESKGLGVQL